MDSLSPLYQDPFWESLGFDMRNIKYFSYKGLLKSDGENRPRGEPFVFHTPYSSEDTVHEIPRAARLLERQIEKIHKEFPGKKIDIVGHSQGGAIAQEYIRFFYNPNDPKGPKLGPFVSISSPHRGAEGARGYSMLTDTDAGRRTYPYVEFGATLSGLPPGSAPSSQQLNPDSLHIRRGLEYWDPEKVKATNIATALDFAVTPQNTRLPGAMHYTSWVDPNQSELMRHHSNVIGELETKGILYNALRGTPSRCTGFMNVMADHVTGPTLQGVENLAFRGLDGIASRIGELVQ